MRKPYSVCNIIDVEASCWAEKSPDKDLTTQVEPVSEIIEIGICQFNFRTNEISKKASILIKPIFSTISPFCESLTGWTDEKLKDGGTFAEACEILRTEYNSRNIPWVSWGDYDRLQFERDIKNKNAPISNGNYYITHPTIEYPFGRRHINLKTLFTIMYGKDKEMGLGEALKEMNTEFIGTQHHGVDDAYNVARIFKYMINEMRLKQIASGRIK